MTDKGKKQWTNRRGAQPVADLVSKLLDPVIERRAGMTMDLIASWEDIVGSKHAAQSRPEKLTWPRPTGDEGGFEPATLIVACDGGYALFLQHDGDTIIAKVNDYFGFSAVDRMKLVQKPLTKSPRREMRTAPNLGAASQTRLSELTRDVEDSDLKNALEKLGRGVFSTGSSAKK